MFISPKDMQSTNRELHSSRSKLHRKYPYWGRYSLDGPEPRPASSTISEESV